MFERSPSPSAALVSETSLERSYSKSASVSGERGFFIGAGRLSMR